MMTEGAVKRFFKRLFPFLNLRDSFKTQTSVAFAQLLEQDQPYRYLDHLTTRSDAPVKEEDRQILLKIEGCLIGAAICDALGAPFEFRPHSYFEQKSVTEMEDGGTWGLQKGQFTDDTSMTLCLAASLIVQKGFSGYDQMLRYHRWFRYGYFSSTDRCFDIGRLTKDALVNFENKRDKAFRKAHAEKKSVKTMKDFDQIAIRHPNEYKELLDCASPESAGNGSLMRIAPIPIFYYKSLKNTLRYARKSSFVTHNDRKATDACQFYSMLIHQAINGVSKKELLNPDNYDKDFIESLHSDVQNIAKGSYKKGQGYDDGIRGSGYVIKSLEAALWAFENDENSFRRGALLAVNLGDDTDTTASIYGQLAGATYGLDEIPEEWRQNLFQFEFIRQMADELFFLGRDLSVKN